MFTKKDKIIKRNRSFFTKVKKGVKFKDEKYEKYEKVYDFYCPKCRIKFNSDTYRITVTIRSTLNATTKHNCGTRCHRFLPMDYNIVEKLFLNSNKTPLYYPKFKEMKEKYKKRGYERRTKYLNKKDEFEV